MKRDKKWNPPFWNYWNESNLMEFETMRESVRNFMEFVSDNGYSMRSIMYHKKNFHTEIVKNFETDSFAKIDGRGILYKAEIVRKSDVINNYAEKGKWYEVTQGEYFN